MIRWYRFVQPPANGFHPCRGVSERSDATLFPLVPKFYLGTQLCAKLHFAIINHRLRHAYCTQGQKEIEFQESVRSQVQLGNEPKFLSSRKNVNVFPVIASAMMSSNMHKGYSQWRLLRCARNDGKYMGYAHHSALAVVLSAPFNIRSISSSVKRVLTTECFALPSRYLM